METLEIRISDIKIREGWNIRQSVISADINSLKASIMMTGLRHPVALNDQFQLVSGHRRLAACKALGWESIPAVITLYQTEMHERLAHIDENIEAKNLSEKDQEKALAERRRIYELLNPESTKRGPKDETATRSFAADTAAKTGISEDKVRKLTKRVEGVTSEVREAYESDQITSSQIDELVKLPVDEQNRLLDKVKGASIAETRLMVKDYLQAKKTKEQIKKTKKEKEPVAQVEDEKLLAAIIISQRVTRSCSETQILLQDLLTGNKHELLDKSYLDSIHLSIKNLQAAIDTVLDKIGVK
jgi:ParB-like chromosome segregation protein Spo0J